MRSKHKRWVFFWVLTTCCFEMIICEVVDVDERNSTQKNKESTNFKEVRSIFSPRMDYDQWKPLGRGDPLKNDPTYDYVPPVLDRVHYWMEPEKRKPDPPLSGDPHKTEVLLLGISSKKPSTRTSVADSRRDNFDPFLKFVDGPKFNSHQKISRPHYPIPSSYYPSPFYANKNKISERNNYQKGNEQRVPYTILMPPPILTPIKKPSLIQQLPIVKPMTLQQLSTSTAKTTQEVVSHTKAPISQSTSSVASSTTTSPQVTIQASNLIYQSSSLGGLNDWNNKHKYVTVSPHNPNEVNWDTSTKTSALTSSTKRVKPDYNEEIVFQQHNSPPESYIQINFAQLPTQQINLTNNNPLIADGSSHNINYVTPPPLVKNEMQEVMHKGEVTDDNIDVANSYVKIGKPEAQMHSTGLDMSDIPVPQPDMIMRRPGMHQRPMLVYSHVQHPLMHNEIMPPMSMQTLQNMQTMKPPPITNSSPVYTKPTNPILNALEKEKATTSIMTVPTTIVINTTPEITTTNFVTTNPPPSTSTSTTTTMRSLTTDPLFKHYKQPVEPLKGPLYLIIQGHSKVKTYGPTKQIHGIKIQETNEITDDQDSVYKVKHLHNYKKQLNDDDISDNSSREARSGNLQTLKHVIQTGLGSIDFSNVPSVIKRRNDNDFRETELHVGYEVVDAKDVTSEKYHKGIVEEARKLKFVENVTVH